MNREINLTDAYTKFALHIHACKQEVSLDKIKELCKALNIEYQARLASMFVMSKERYSDLLLAINSGSVGGVSRNDEIDNKTAEVKKEVIEEEEEESDGDDDFMNFD